jgi:lipid-A-disaccharide synthase
VERILPVFLKTRKLLADRDARLRWVIASAPGLPADAFSTADGATEMPEIREGETYDLLAAADLALTASGTATLEAALLGIPMLVVYRMHPLTWFLAKRLVRVPHVAMANLLAGERLVPEYLQEEARADRLAEEILRWMANPERRQRTSEALRQVAAKLGEGGAPRRAAEAILGECSG